MWEEDVLKAFGFVVGALATLYFSFVKTFNRDGVRWRKTMKGNAEITPLLKDFVSDQHSSCRATLKVLENGGGIPHVGAQLFSSSLQEENDLGETKYTDNWQRVRVTSTYGALLQEVSILGSVHIEDIHTLEDSDIKDAYILLKAVGLDIYHIKSTKKKWYYLEIAHCSTVTTSPQYRERVRVLKQNLYNLLK